MSPPFFAYMLKCSDDSLYTGHTDDLERRLSQHQTGEGSQFTSTRLPVEMVWFQEFTTRHEAKSAEIRIKGWNRAKKEALIKNDFGLISKLASRSGKHRALRDASSKIEEAPQDSGLDAGQNGRGNI